MSPCNGHLWLSSCHVVLNGCDWTLLKCSEPPVQLGESTLCSQVSCWLSGVGTRSVVYGVARLRRDRYHSLMDTSIIAKGYCGSRIILTPERPRLLWWHMYVIRWIISCELSGQWQSFAMFLTVRCVFCLQDLIQQLNHWTAKSHTYNVWGRFDWKLWANLDFGLGSIVCAPIRIAQWFAVQTNIVPSLVIQSYCLWLYQFIKWKQPFSNDLF